MSIPLDTLPPPALAASLQFRDVLAALLADDLVGIWVDGGTTFPDRPLVPGDLDMCVVVTNPGTISTVGVSGIGAVDPPESLEAPPLLLRRATSDDAAALARAVSQSLDHLTPWIVWAGPEAGSVEHQRTRLAQEAWGPEDYGYLMVLDGVVVGSCGLQRTVGPGGLEISYWVHVDHQGRGYATAATSALTRMALSLAGVDWVEIHCDQANTASAAVARRLGYRLDRIEDRPIDTSGQTGRQMIWVMPTAVKVGRRPQ